MKKTALKSKSRIVARSTAKKVTRTSPPRGVVHEYVRQRDSFFQTHPNAQMLLGIFIVLVAVFIGIKIWGDMQIMNYQVARDLEVSYN